MQTQNLHILFRREVGFRLPWTFLGGVLIFDLLMLVFLGSILFLETTLQVLLLGSPLLLLPAGAAIASRDRDDGSASLLGATPATRWEDACAKALLILTMAILTLCGAAALAALPAAYGLVAWARWVLFIPWGLLVGIVAGCTGLIIGSAFPAKGRTAMAAAFGLAATWVGVAFAAPWLAAFLPGNARLVSAITHASPLMWAVDGLGIVSVSSNPIARFLLAASVWSAGGLVLLLLIAGLQDLQGWRFHPRRGIWHASGAILCVGLILLAGAAVGDAGIQDARPPQATTGITISARTSTPEGDTFVDVIRGDDVKVSLMVEGSPGQKVRLGAFATRSDQVELIPKTTLPDVLILDGTGRGEVVFLASALIKTLEGRGAFLSVTLLIDGKPITSSTMLLIRPGGTSLAQAPFVPLAVTAVLPVVIGLLVAANRLPRRMNRW